MPSLADMINAEQAQRRAQMTHYDSYGQGKSIDQMRQEASQRIYDAPARLAQGAFTGLAGAPVDIANMALQPIGLGSERPVGGSNYLASLINAPTESGAYQAGTMLPIGPEGLAMGGAKLAGLAGIFAGKGAKTANLAALAKAEELKAAGVPDADIWKQTGWTLNTPDKMPRFEIPDNLAQFDASRTKPSDKYFEVGIGNLGDVMSHPQLSKSYPSISDITMELNPNMSSQGSYSDDILQIKRASEPIRKSELAQWRDRLIYEHTPESVNEDVKWLMSSDGLSESEARKIINESHADALREVNQDLSASYLGDTSKSTALHELQHAIQQREGFARGGSPEQFSSVKELNRTKAQAESIASVASDKFNQLPEELKQYARAINRGDDIGGEAYAKIAANPKAKELWADYVVAQRQVSELLGGPQQIDMLTPQDQYQRLAGEAEARLTQSRMAMTPEQRLAQYPYDPEYFRQSTGVGLQDLIVRQEGGNKLSRMAISAPSKTEFELANEVAQRNAALPVNQGGLGLPPNNTAMDRARAMGFDTPAYHGSLNANQASFTPSRGGELGAGTYITDDPNLASEFARTAYGAPFPENAGVYPLLTKELQTMPREEWVNKRGGIMDALRADNKGEWEARFYNQSMEDMRRATESEGKYGWYTPGVGGVNQGVVFEPSNIRSRFAAFDPMQRKSANILAGIASGAIGLDTLYNQENTNQY